MPTLNWIGKDAVINHHQEVPFRLLKCRADLSVGAPDSGNLLVQGDNLEALKALLPYYAGQVKCIYIDPPYNTGNEGWAYNDNVNSPEMREWLGKVVGGEAEDLSRHDKWLSMMYPRLVLLHQMLTSDGSLWMSIDDNEVHSARMLLDEIFGRNNFVATIVWQKKYSAANDSTGIPPMHDYILVYAKSKLFDRKLLPRTEKQDKAYKNPDNDPRGPWKAVDYTSNKTRQERPNLYYPLIHPSTGKEIWPKESRVWGFAKELHEEHIKDNRIWWGHNNKNSIPALKRFLSEVQGGIVPVTWWPHEDGGHTDEAKKEVLQILDKLPGYMTPKPTRLIQRILQITTSENDLIMDSFAGSGTTGHAVLKQNSEDGGNRRFILIEMEPGIATPITAKRLKAVIDGYKDIEGLGSGFRYCELGATLFDPNRQIREEVKYNDLAQHVYFVETGQPLPQNARKHYPLLGVSNGTAVYLLYNGILKDKSVNGGNVLTYDVLEGLPPPSVPPFSQPANGKATVQQGENGGMSERTGGLKVTDGNVSRISKARLNDLGIVFKQIPYEIREM